MVKIKILFQYFSSFEGSLFRYSLAFSFLLALFPMLIVIVMLFHNSIFDIDILLDYLYRFIPEDLMQGFITYIMDKSYTNIVTLVISLVVALNLASRSLYSFLLISANYEGYNLPKFVIRVKAYILFIVLMLSVGVIGFIASFLHYPAFVSMGFGLFIVCFLLYRILAFEKKPLHYGLLGAVFATLAIWATSQLFLTLINLLTSYNNVYGPMASLLIALLSIYVVSSIIYFGYCLNLVYGPVYSNQTYKHEKLDLFILNTLTKIKKDIRGVFR